MTHTSDIGKARPTQGTCRTERKLILENNASEQVILAATAIYKQQRAPIDISGLASSTCSPFSCTLIPSLNLLWSHRLRCATHFRQSVPALRQVLRKLRDVRALKFSLSSTWPTVFYLLKLCAKVMLLQCNPKYPRDFHHSSSIKALKCEDLKMQLSCLRFQP